MRLLFILALALPVSASAQFIASAGAGNLFGGDGLASGGNVQWYRSNSIDSFDLLYDQKRLLPGFFHEFGFHGYDVTGGTQLLGFSQDVASVSLSCVCISVKKKNSHTTLQFFAGGLSQTSYFLPFAVAGSPNTLGAGTLLVHKWKYISASSLETWTQTEWTAAQNLSFTTTHLKGALDAGYLNKEKFWSASASGTSKGFSMDAEREQFFANSVIPFNAISDGAGVGYSKSVLSIGGSVNEGISQIRLVGFNINAGVRFSSFGANFGFYDSHNSVQQRLETANVFERISRHITTNETLSHGQSGSLSVSGGASLLWNGLSLSFGQNVQFLIAEGYQSERFIQLSIRVHDTTVSVQSVVDPFGHLYWLADQQTYIGAGNFPGGAIAPAHRGIGRIIFLGSCKTPDGTALAGCVIDLGTGKNRLTAVSNDAGVFEIRTNKTKPLAVRFEQMAMPGEWSPVSVPGMAEPGQEIHIIIARMSGPSSLLAQQ